MKFSEEIAKAAREEFERGKEFGSGKFRRPPVNMTLAEVYSELYRTADYDIDTAELKSRIAAGTAIWERICLRFVIRKYWYRIRFKIWYIFTGGGPAG